MDDVINISSEDDGAHFQTPNLDICGDLYQLENPAECIGFNIIGAYGVMLNMSNKATSVSHLYAFDPCAVDTRFSRTLTKIHKKVDLMKYRYLAFPKL